jgi:citrate lyase subunit beta / citryl-CoA lyase
MIDLPAGPAWLFCPADRPERFAKAAAAADVVIIDLEDGVAPGARAEARLALSRVAHELDSGRTVIRISPVGTDDHRRDLETLLQLDFGLVMLAKTESADAVRSLAGLQVVALCETPRGIVSAAQIAAVENCAALVWGAEDLIAALGGLSSRDQAGMYRDVARHARSEVLLAAGSASTPALDAVYLDMNDSEGLRAEAVDAVASGFAAKLCIHPRQASVVREAFAPTTQQVAWASRILAAVTANEGQGVFSLDGQMIDEPLIRQARRVLSRYKPSE